MIIKLRIPRNTNIIDQILMKKHMKYNLITIISNF